MARLNQWLIVAGALLACLGPVQAVPLWEIEGTDNRILMLGSVHLLRADDYPLPEVLDQAYRDADIIVLELALDELDPVSMQQTFATYGRDPEGRSLDEWLGSSDWQKAQQLSAELGIDLNLLRDWEPWFVAMQVTQLQLMKLGFDGSLGIERYVMTQAAADGKPIQGLETLQAQLSAFDTLPDDVQRQFLLQSLEEAGSIDSELQSIVSAWRSADLDTLDELLLTGLAEQPELYRYVLVERNRRWARKIAALKNDGRDYLIVFGTLHLIGPDSVPALLEEAGISSRQVR